MEINNNRFDGAVPSNFHVPNNHQKGSDSSSRKSNRDKASSISLPAKAQKKLSSYITRSLARLERDHNDMITPASKARYEKQSYKADMGR